MWHQSAAADTGKSPCEQRSTHSELNLASFNLHQLVAGGDLDAVEVQRELIRACEINGLMADRENGGLQRVLATIKSGARAGLQHPRGLR